MSRDRDDQGRPRNARRRDPLGRPLPRTGAESAPPADPPALTPGNSLVKAQRLLDAGQPFEAHEVLEMVWKATQGSERELWRGLAQLAVGVTHHARGNAQGAEQLLRRGARSIAPYAGSRPHDIRIDALQAWADVAAEAATSTSLPPMPRLTGQAADDRA